MRIRPAMAQDQPNVVALDARITSIPKPDYWASMFDQFVGQDGQHFSHSRDKRWPGDGLGFAGFIIGEVRAWEFGSLPCGWILTILVAPEFQGKRVGEMLFRTISA